MPATTERVDTIWFAAAVRAVRNVARHQQLAVIPGFRSAPTGQRRTIARRHGRTVVTVDVRGRNRHEVLEDLCVGVAVANGEPADSRLAAQLRTDVVDERFGDRRLVDDTTSTALSHP